LQAAQAESQLILVFFFFCDKLDKYKYTAMAENIISLENLEKRIHQLMDCL